MTPIKVTLAEVSAAHPVYQALRGGTVETHWSKQDWMGTQASPMCKIDWGYVIETGGEMTWHASAMLACVHLKEEVDAILEAGAAAEVSTPINGDADRWAYARHPHI